MKRSLIGLLFLAFFITIASAYFQKKTGPTYPIKRSITIEDHFFKIVLPRSAETLTDAKINIGLPESSQVDWIGYVKFKRYNSYDEWQQQPLIKDNNNLIANIPHQPPAGKIMYSIFIGKKDFPLTELTSEPVIMRFKGSVPSSILIAHIIFIFMAMFLSNYCGVKIIAKQPVQKWLIFSTAFMLLFGGLVFGPIVQKYAFQAYWTGWPWGYDLTDNKTALAMIFWCIPVWQAFRAKSSLKTRNVWILVASIVLLLIYLIPHSTLGSELDHRKTEKTTISSNF